VLAEDVKRICSEDELLGLHINADKCELVWRPDFLPSSAPLKDFLLVNLQNAALLGAPLFKGKLLHDALDRCCSDLTRDIDRLLKLIETHDALERLKACFSAPKVQPLLRCSPCHDHPALHSLVEIRYRSYYKLQSYRRSDDGLPVKDGSLCARQVQRRALVSCKVLSFRLVSLVKTVCLTTIKSVGQPLFNPLRRYLNIPLAGLSCYFYSVRKQLWLSFNDLQQFLRNMKRRLPVSS